MSTYTECKRTKTSKEIKILIIKMFKLKWKINPKMITLSKIDNINNKFSNFLNKTKL